MGNQEAIDFSAEMSAPSPTMNVYGPSFSNDLCLLQTAWDTSPITSLDVVQDVHEATRVAYLRLIKKQTGYNTLI